jgi:hypothetical protein
MRFKYVLFFCVISQLLSLGFSYGALEPVRSNPKWLKKSDLRNSDIIVIDKYKDVPSAEVKNNTSHNGNWKSINNIDKKSKNVSTINDRIKFVKGSLLKKNSLPPDNSPKIDGFAAWAFILAILPILGFLITLIPVLSPLGSILAFLGFVWSPFTMFFSIFSKRRIQNKQTRGIGLSFIGLVLGGLYILISLIFVGGILFSLAYFV